MPGTGQPLADYGISTAAQAKYFRGQSDVQGRYKLSDLPPGSYRLAVRAPGLVMPRMTRTITLAGAPLEVDFELAAMGAISGRIVNDAKEPVPGATAFLVGAAERVLGAAWITSSRGWSKPARAGSTRSRA